MSEVLIGCNLLKDINIKYNKKAIRNNNNLFFIKFIASYLRIKINK